MNDNESEDTLNAADFDPRTTPMYRSAPERIGLAIGCRDADLWQTDFGGCKDVTWYSGEPPEAVTIGYVRADLYDALQAALDVQEKDAERYQWLVENSYFSLPNIQNGDVVLIHKIPAQDVHPTDWKAQTTAAIDAAIEASKEDV